MSEDHGDRGFGPLGDSNAIKTDTYWEGGKNNKILDPEKSAAATQFDHFLTSAITLLIKEEDPSNVAYSDSIRKLLTNNEGKRYTQDQLYAIEDFWQNQAVQGFWRNLAEHETGVRNANLPPAAPNPNPNHDKQ